MVDWAYYDGRRIMTTEAIHKQCDGCVFWELDEGISAVLIPKKSGWGNCHRFDHNADGWDPLYPEALAQTSPESPDPSSGFYTAPNFGCVEWKEKAQE